MAQEMTEIAIALNCLLAALVCWLTLGLWRWRCAIARMNQALQSQEVALSIAPKQAGYELALKRMQIAETRLNLAQWQRRSRQIQKTLQLIRGLRTLMLMRSGSTRFRRLRK